MPLIDINDSIRQLRKVCALCGVVDIISIDSIVLGAMIIGPDPNAILLPSCSSCAARETLVRTWELEPEGGGGINWDHRKAVNALAALLKSEDLVHPAVVGMLKAETKSPSAVARLPVVITTST